MEFIAKGEFAKQMLEEIQRQPNKKELDALIRAMKDRIPKTKTERIVKMKKINTYDMILAVCFNDTEIIVDHGGVEQSEFWFDGSCFCFENGFVGLPNEVGVYQCKVEHWTGADIDSGEWEFRVVESVKINTSRIKVKSLSAQEMKESMEARKDA